MCFIVEGTARRGHSDGGARVVMSSASGAIRALRALVGRLK